MTDQIWPLARSAGSLAIWLALLSAVFIPLEHLFSVEPRKFWRRGLGADLGYYFLNGLATSALLSLPVALLAATAHRLIAPGFLETMASLPIWARAVLGLVAGETGYYWGHRLSHEIPILWRFHAIHHSAEDVDYLTNTRAHPLDMVFGRFCGLVPMYLLGLAGPVGAEGTLLPVVVMLFGTVWGFFVHSNVNWRLGPLEWVVSTPAFHHWHHTKSGPINKNYASTLPWLDRLFGTHHLPDSFPSDYGIQAPMPEAMVDQLVHPFFPAPPKPAADLSPSPESATPAAPPAG